jgi:lipopolysaccharide/colanic/teichoic acid biosynthesis glycosyltransferase
MSAAYARIKTGVDTALAAALLLPLLPLMGAIAVAIRLDSPGPVLFRQQRVGLGRRPFAIYKFRTMIHREQIDQRNEAIVAGRHDPRVTRTGAFLRRSSLDELPQLFNVLLGQMSLVGPRPVIPEQLLAMGPEHGCRFAVKPGITGLAQVSGRRNLAWPEQLRLDCSYARSASLRTDLRILLQTLGVAAAAEGIDGGSAANWRQFVREKNHLGY